MFIFVARKNHRSWLDDGNLSVAEAASALGVTEQTVRRWCDQYLKTGDSGRHLALRSIKHANKYRLIPKEAVADLLARRSNAPAARELARRRTSSELHFLPQLVWYLEALAGRACAEALLGPYDTTTKLAEEIQVLIKRTKLMVEELEHRPSTAKDVASLKKRTEAVEDRLSQLSAENRNP